jgi:hypothetical protein
MPTVAFPEKAVVEIWQRYLPGRTDLITEEGERIKIVYPGMVNGDRGADLVDAVISADNRLLKGNIEVHVKASSWWTHGHHEDPAYNDVILHVVYRQDKKEAVNLQSGKTIPTIILGKYFRSHVGLPFHSGDSDVYRVLPCHSKRNLGDREIIGKILDKAGEKRFLTKAAGFRKTITKSGERQALYEAVMESLGYAKNKSQMATLARHMPREILEAGISERLTHIQNLARLQALLLGRAGLLPSQRTDSGRWGIKDDSWVDRLEKLWASSGMAPAMNESDWHFYKVRPGNIPTRRIAAMSHLLLRSRQQGMPEDLVEYLLYQDTGTCCREMEQLLYIPAAGYWAEYLDFGIPGWNRLPALLGRARVADIIINVLLPFALVRSEQTSYPGVSQKILEIFHRYPRLTVNHVERHMCNQLGIHSCLVNSAKRQQGLIHIYKTLCSQGKCQDCPLGTR